MSSPGPLRGKVVKILSDYSIVMDLGRSKGVKRGDRFIIYEVGEMIKDAEGRELEKLELVKGEVEVTQVQEKISIAESFHIVRKMYNPLSSPFAPYEYADTVKQKVAETDNKEGIKVGPVHVGDWVRKLD